MSFPPIPLQGSLCLARASVPVSLLEPGSWRVDADGLTLIDIKITDGIITKISESGDTLPIGAVDLNHGQVWPTFVDVHTHLDKGHILPRASNPDGTVYGAVQSVAIDRKSNWSSKDIRRRFEFGLRCAYAHGTSAIRTHLDCDPPQAAISFPVFAALREQWAGKIALQAVGKLPLDQYLTRDGDDFAKLVAEHAGLLGGVTALFGNAQDKSLGDALDALFQLAQRHDLDIDLHVDETGNPAATSLSQVAQAAISGAGHVRPLLQSLGSNSVGR